MQKDNTINFFTTLNNCAVINGNVTNYFNHGAHHEGAKGKKYSADEYEDAIIVEEISEVDNKPAEDNSAGGYAANCSPDDLEDDEFEDEYMFRSQIISQITDRFAFLPDNLQCPLVYQINIRPDNEDIIKIFQLIFGLPVDGCPLTAEEQEMADHFYTQLTKMETRTPPFPGENFSRIRVANILGFFKKSESIILLNQKKILEMIFGKETVNGKELAEDEYSRLKTQMSKELSADQYNDIFPRNSGQFIRRCIKAVFSAKLSQTQ